MSDTPLKDYMESGDWQRRLDAHFATERTARETAEATVARLREECEALRADAERYRFLRVRIPGGEARVIANYLPRANGAATDAAIDRAADELRALLEGGAGMEGRDG